MGKRDADSMLLYKIRAPQGYPQPRLKQDLTGKPSGSHGLYKKTERFQSCIQQYPSKRTFLYKNRHTHAIIFSSIPTQRGFLGLRHTIMTITVNVPIDGALHAELQKEQQEAKATTGKKPTLAKLLLGYIASGREAMAAGPADNVGATMQTPEDVDMAYLLDWQRHLSARASELREQETHLLQLHGKAHATMAECRIQRDAIKRKKAHLRAVEAENQRLVEENAAMAEEMGRLKLPKKLIEEKVAQRTSAMEMHMQNVKDVYKQMSKQAERKYRDAEESADRRERELMERIRERESELRGLKTKAHGDMVGNLPIEELKSLVNGVVKEAMEEAPKNGDSWSTKDTMFAIGILASLFKGEIGDFLKDLMGRPSNKQTSEQGNGQPKGAPEPDINTGKAKAAPQNKEKQATGRESGPNGTAGKQQEKTVFPNGFGAV